MNLNFFTSIFLLFMIPTLVTCSALENVHIKNVTSTSFMVTFGSTASATFCLKVTQRHNISNIAILRTNQTTVEVVGLKSNLIYDVQVKVQLPNKTWSDYNNQISIRTAPGGCGIVNYFTTPSFITLFLEEVPAATEWEVEYAKTSTNEAPTILNAPVDGPTKTNYVIVLTNLNANTMYSVRARISQVLNSINYTQQQSPYGNSVDIATEKLSVFGRVLLLSQPYDSMAIKNETYVTEIESRLISFYKRYNQDLVDDIKVVEFESEDATLLNSSNTLCHFEIKVQSLTSIRKFDEDKYGFESMYEEYNGAKAWSYSYKENELTGTGMSSEENCHETDERFWIVHNDLRLTIKQSLNEGRESNKPDNLQRITLNNEGETYDYNIGIFDNTNRFNEEPFFDFVPNSVYAIQHNYLLKTCPADTRLPFFDRLHSASAIRTPISNKYTVVYTTGPGPMDSHCDSVHIFPINSSDPFMVLLRFDVQSVSKAIRYQFSVLSSGGSIIEEIIKTELDIDSSNALQIFTSHPVRRNMHYSLNMSVTTRLANRKNSTSVPSTFHFFTGPTNSTSFRIIEVTKSSFKVRWKKSQCANGYVISVSNMTYSRTYTTTMKYEYLIQRNDSQEIPYNVTVASINGFGMSSFSLASVSIFWKFYNISNSSFILEWDGEATDSQYRISTAPSTNTTVHRKLVFGNLEAGVVYNVNVSFLDETGLWTLLFSADQITAPAKPNDLRQRSFNLTSVTVIWNPVIGVSLYDVKFTLANNNKFEARTTAFETATLSGLLAGRWYNVSVRSRNSVGVSDFTTSRLQTGKDIPVITNISNVTSSSFTVQWSSALHTQIYDVIVKNLRTNTIKRYANTTSTPAQATELSAGHTYSVTVIALYETGLSMSRESINQTLVPDAPASVSKTSIGFDYAFRISWDNSFGADLYKIEIQTDNFTHNNTTERNFFDLTNACGGANHNVTVWAINSAGVSHPRRYQFTSDRFLPENVLINKVTETEITLSWRLINCARSYRLRVISSAVDERTVVEDAKSSQSTVKGLEGGTNYTIEIDAEYQFAEFGKATEVSVITASENPPTLDIVSVTESSATLQWQKQRSALEYRFSVVHFGEVVEIKTYNSNENRTETQGLSAGQPYNFSLVTISNVGAHLPKYENRNKIPRSYVITATQPPQNVTVQAIQERNLVLTWKKPSGAVSYRIMIIAYKADRKNVTRVYISERSEVHITDLEVPALSYSATVQALNDQSYFSERSDPLVIAGVPTTGIQKAIPWWAILAASAGFLFLLLIAVVVLLKIQKKRRVKRTEIYEVEEKRKSAALQLQKDEMETTNLSHDTQGMSKYWDRTKDLQFTSFAVVDKDVKQESERSCSNEDDRHRSTSSLAEPNVDLPVQVEKNSQNVEVCISNTGLQSSENEKHRAALDDVKAESIDSDKSHNLKKGIPNKQDGVTTTFITEKEKSSFRMNVKNKTSVCASVGDVPERDEDAAQKKTSLKVTEVSEAAAVKNSSSSINSVKGNAEDLDTLVEDLTVSLK